jgi:hypothetical protein
VKGIAVRQIAGFASFVPVVAALVATTGCSVTQSVHTDEHIRPYLHTLAKHPDQPLARTLTWKYHYTLGRANYEQNWFVADGKLVRDKKAMDGVQLYAAQKATSGTSMSDVYAERAREATTAGRYSEAEAYRGRSEVAARTQMASESVALGMALGGEIQKLGAAALDAVIVSGAQNAAAYIKDDRVPTISERAPEGTVLELFFRGHKLDGNDAKPATITMRWETVATLKDAQGRLWRSSSVLTTYFLITLGSEPLPVPPEFGQRRLVQMDVGLFVPAQDDRGAYAQEIQEIGKIARRSGLVELGVTAAQAIDDIYAQMRLAKTGRR